MVEHMLALKTLAHVGTCHFCSHFVSQRNHMAKADVRDLRKHIPPIG